MSPDGGLVYANKEKVMNLLSEKGAELHLYAVWN